MKIEKKRVGTKARTTVGKDRERRRAMFLAIIPIIVIFSSYLTYNFLNQPQNQTTKPASSESKAAIVDQLSLTFPNQSFVESATNTLEQAGYTVDYYPSEEVTVEFYRNLPTHGYGIILLRVHSSASGSEGTQRVEVPVVLFTSELYSSTKYVYQQLVNQVVPVSYNVPDPPYYFAIDPSFVTSSTTGEFQNTLVIMMGCEGLNNTKMAEAFIQKGAKTYIGWKGTVSASHTDTATTRLLQHFLLENQTLKQAVQETFVEVGPDPAYGSLLIYYPLGVGEQTIENIKR